MADPKDKTEKTIEMRLAELEDKVSKIHITEEEIKAYQKVASMLGGGGAAEAQADPTMGAAAASSIQCIIPRQIWRGITPRIVPRRGIECYECSCGPCNMGGGGGFGGGGFGGFGM
jgi:hypothetical protein